MTSLMPIDVSLLSLLLTFKVGFSLSRKICFICFNEIPLKMIKNAFYCILKDIQIFVLTFWSCRENGLVRNMRLISKFMTSQHGYQTITIHILPNISRSKGNRQ